jgi:hypothetical protein
MTIAVRGAGSGRLRTGKSVDMRGNTKESWSRLPDGLVTNRLRGPGAL